jgi:hypothetical protein
MNTLLVVLLLGKATFISEPMPQTECQKKIENRQSLPSQYFTHAREDHTLVCVPSNIKVKIGKEL